jgi:hypothetical protein
MAKRPAHARRKLVEFDEETWAALDLLGRDSMKTLQELADEAFRDLLRKYDRPTDLKAALKQSARSSPAPPAVAQNRSRGRRELKSQVEGGGAKKHRRLPSGRLQRQNSPSGEGWASANGTDSYIDGPMPASGPWMIT